jgi:ABC-type transport system involved in multi-copper enzyme maturation permease subunit
VIVRSILAVFGFEIRRTLTPSRLFWWLLLAMFPALIVGMIRIASYYATRSHGPGNWDVNPGPGFYDWMKIVFALVPMLVSMLGTFLWASPAISAELENKSWVYLAVRPHGTIAVMLGKYLATVAWSLSAALVGLLVALQILPDADAGRIFATNLPLTLLSCPSYAALYLLLGTLFPKRSMVISVAYTLVLELIVSWMPALINTCTIQFRIRTLFFYWSGISELPETHAMLVFVGEPPAWEHALILVAYTLVVLVAAVAVAHYREFAVNEAVEAGG